MFLLAEFHDKKSVCAAVESLRAGGLDAVDIDLFSGEPVELPATLLDRPSRMSLASVVGAVAAGSLATAFVSWAQHNYKLATGGMPVFSFWATGVITYEMTMLGAIVTTFAWFLWESGLIRKRGARAPVPGVAPGSIFLRVRCPAENAPALTEKMRRAGAIGIERRGE